MFSQHMFILLEINQLWYKAVDSIYLSSNYFMNKQLFTYWALHVTSNVTYQWSFLFWICFHYIDEVQLNIPCWHCIYELMMSIFLYHSTSDDTSSCLLVKPCFNLLIIYNAFICSWNIYHCSQQLKWSLFWVVNKMALFVKRTSAISRFHSHTHCADWI